MFGALNGIENSGEVDDCDFFKDPFNQHHQIIMMDEAMNSHGNLNHHDQVPFHSTNSISYNNEYSSHDNTIHSGIKQTLGLQKLGSFSNEAVDDAVYVPFEYQGDGRKREAKRHKMQTLVAKDEIEIDKMIKEHQNTNHKIIESEQALDELRTLKISKKELQSKRNRLTAQLSRDRQKLEMSFLKAMCVNYQRLLRRLESKLVDDSQKEPFCDSCRENLDNTLEHHRKNLTQPRHVELETEGVVMPPL